MHAPSESCCAGAVDVVVQAALCPETTAGSRLACARNPRPGSLRRWRRSESGRWASSRASSGEARALGGRVRCCRDAQLFGFEVLYPTQDAGSQFCALGMQRRVHRSKGDCEMLSIWDERVRQRKNTDLEGDEATIRASTLLIIGAVDMTAAVWSTLVSQ